MSAVTPDQTAPKRNLRGASAGASWSNLIFVLPYLIIFAVLLVFPLFYGMYISAHSTDMFDDTSKFSGLANYTRLFKDAIFLGALRNTFLFVAITVPVFTILGLTLAIALNRRTRTAAVLRATFFGTSVLSVTIVTIIWKMMYLPDFGMFASVVKAAGFEPIPFLTNAHLVMPAISIVTVWWGIGLPMMLFLAALQQIPNELYEAAALDNAGRWKTLRFIILPAVARTTLVVVIYEIIAQFQLFGQAWLLTQGGPNNSSRPVVEFIYEKGFRDWDLGYAASASEVLFSIMVAVALLQYFATRKRHED